MQILTGTEDESGCCLGNWIHMESFICYMLYGMHVNLVFTQYAMCRLWIRMHIFCPMLILMSSCYQCPVLLPLSVCVTLCCFMCLCVFMCLCGFMCLCAFMCLFVYCVTCCYYWPCLGQVSLVKEVNLNVIFSWLNKGYIYLEQIY